MALALRLIRLGLVLCRPALPFSNLEIALAFVALLACLLAGGALLRRGKTREEPGEKLSSLQEQAAVQAAEAAALLTKCTALEAERSEAQAQCVQLQAECTDAREEAELILLQLHQVQEELEHYFLLSQDLQQQLDQGQSSHAAASEADAVTPSDSAAATLAHHTSEELQHFKQRLASLLQKDPSSTRSALWSLIRRQQAALRRFERLHRSQTATIPAPSLSGASPTAIADGDVVMI